jgi:uncharacterized protein
MSTGAAVASAVGLVRTLRAAGVGAGPDRALAFIEALAAVDPSRPADAYWAGRLTLCADPDDIARYDQVFAAYFTGWRPPDQPSAQTASTQQLPAGSDAGSGSEAATTTGVVASAAEALRRADIAELDPAQRAELDRLLAAFRLRGEPRRTSRLQPARRGRIDPGRSVRALLHNAGEPAELRYRRPASRPRRVVLLVDISGSMAPYATALLRFAHAAALGARSEVFTLGTRLTRVTAQMAHRDPDTAMAALAEAVPDWAGGTRLGQLLKEFCDRWGQRGMARGAVVVILSDGWERDAPALLGRQMARLARLAHRVVWANPRKAKSGYEPLAGGIAAALPFVDDFVEGHSLGALERLAAVVAGRA